MSRRWKMNRIGFINFWLYDDEIFELEDGKIFFRGGNGSGKSITTQSVISFLMDGDRSPERLDSFGGRDRKMEYYFLGDGEKEDETGYIFLELKKEDTEQYITIGIGQRAKRGSNLEFAGFCITDGKRVGKDIKLYREIGGKKIPLSLKRELPNILGDGNRIVYSQKEYIDMVNKNIFGFDNLEQYKNLIRFLLKIRGAKLSKETKLLDIYKILNDALPTLTDEDLRVLIDTMERIKDMEEMNEEQKKILEIIKRLERIYDIYNKNLLWKKSKKFFEQEREYTLEKKNFEKEREKIEKYKVELKNNEDEIEKNLNRLEGIREEKKVLENNNLDKAVEELQENKRKKERVENEIERKKRRENEEQEKLESYKIKDRNLRRDLENKRYILKKSYKELEDINEILIFENSLTKEEVIFQADYEEIFKENMALLEIYSDKLAKALEILKAEKEVAKILNECEEEYDRVAQEKIELEQNYNMTLDMEEREKDRLIEKYCIIKDRNEFLKIKKDELEQIIEYIKEFDILRSPKEITNIFYKNYTKKLTELDFEKRELIYRRDEKSREKERVILEIENLKNQPEVTPLRSREREECRAELEREGIRALPLYETLDFAENLEEDEKKILEEQLKELGLIDILVIPYADQERANKIIAKYSDTILVPKNENGTKKIFEKFKVEDIDESYREVVEDFLKNISTENIDIEKKSIILKKNGYFKYGITQGYVLSKDVEFIGAQNRRNRIAKEILSLELKIEKLNEEIEIYNSHIISLEEKLKRLEKEYSELPDFEDIGESINLRINTEEKVKKIIEDYKVKSENLEGVRRKKYDVEQKVAQACRTLNFKRNIESFEEAILASKEYLKKLIELRWLRVEYENIESTIESNMDSIEEKTYILEEILEDIRRFEREKEKLLDGIKKIEEFLKLPENIELGEKLKKLSQEEEALQKIIENRKSFKIKSEVELKQVTETSQKREKRLLLLEEICKKAKEYFEEEERLGFITLEEIDREAEYLKDGPNKIYERLENRYREYSGVLKKYNGEVEYIFDDVEGFIRRRAVINFFYEGQKISLYRFKEMLSEEISMRETVLAESDRKLIEDILSGNISHKINVQIYETKKWIEKTSENLQKLSNSMRLKFAIEWLPKKSSDKDELNTLELQRLLIKDRELLTEEDMKKLSNHFRNKLSVIRVEIRDSGGSYSEVIKEMLDYRKWFDFTIFFYKDGGSKKELTSSIFNKFSGGERAIAMYLPLLTAASAQYQKGRESSPRIIALDEAFAGVDDKNIASVFEFIETLDFDYIMNSQNLWGTYNTVKRLKIVELIKNTEDNMIITNNFIWDGINNKKEFIL